MYGRLFSNRFHFQIRASQHTKEKIKVIVNSGFFHEFNAEEHYTPDDFQEIVAAAFKDMKLQKLPDHVMFHILRRQFGHHMPPTLTSENIICFFNNIHLSYSKLQPLYLEMREYWEEKFKEKLGKNKNFKSSSTAEGIAGKLTTHFGGSSLAKEELNRFGGYNWRFNGDDAMGFLRQSSRNSKYIDCDQFCDAMENCVRRILNPTLLSAFRPRSSHGTQKST